MADFSRELVYGHLCGDRVSGRTNSETMMYMRIEELQT